MTTLRLHLAADVDHVVLYPGGFAQTELMPRRWLASALLLAGMT